MTAKPLKTALLASLVDINVCALLLTKRFENIRPEKPGYVC